MRYINPRYLLYLLTLECYPSDFCWPFLSIHLHARKGPPRFPTEGRRSMTKSGVACVYCVYLFRRI